MRRIHSALTREGCTELASFASTASKVELALLDLLFPGQSTSEGVRIKFPRQPPLSAVAQYVALQNRAPFGVTRPSHNGVNWRGTMCPSEFGRNYSVELDYLIGATPTVWLREPNLRELSGGRRLPHVYAQPAQRL